MHSPLEPAGDFVAVLIVHALPEMLSRFGSSALRSAHGAAAARGLHATAASSMYFKRMELEVWFDKWQ